MFNHEYYERGEDGVEVWSVTNADDGGYVFVSISNSGRLEWSEAANLYGALGTIFGKAPENE